MSLSAVDIFLTKLQGEICGMQRAHVEKVDKVYQRHTNLIEQVRFMYEKNGIKSIMRIRGRRNDTLFVSSEDTRKLARYHEVYQTGVKLEAKIDQMKEDHKLRMLPLKKMQESLRSTCVEALMTKPLTTYAAKKIKEAHEKREAEQQVVREAEQQVACAAERAAARHATQMKAQQIANAAKQQLARAAEQQIARAAEQQVMTNAQKRKLRRSQAKQAKHQG